MQKCLNDFIETKCLIYIPNCFEVTGHYISFKFQKFSKVVSFSNFVSKYLGPRRMEELKDASIHHTAIKISNEIKNMKLYSQLYKTVQVNNK